MMEWKIRLRTAGATKYRPIIWASSSVWSVVGDMVSQQPIGPTKPAVPMPAPAALFVILSHMVDTGPRIAEVSVGASHMIGLRTMFPICNIDVPRP